MKNSNSGDVPARFKQEFSALRTQSIQTQLLPAFDRGVFDRAFMGEASGAPAAAGAPAKPSGG